MRTLVVLGAIAAVAAGEGCSDYDSNSNGCNEASGCKYVGTSCIDEYNCAIYDFSSTSMNAELECLDDDFCVVVENGNPQSLTCNLKCEFWTDSNQCDDQEHCIFDSYDAYCKPVCNKLAPDSCSQVTGCKLSDDLTSCEDDVTTTTERPSTTCSENTDQTLCESDQVNCKFVGDTCFDANDCVNAYSNTNADWETTCSADSNCLVLADRCALKCEAASTCALVTDHCESVNSECSVKCASLGELSCLDEYGCVWDGNACGLPTTTTTTTTTTQIDCSKLGEPNCIGNSLCKFNYEITLCVDDCSGYNAENCPSNLGCTVVGDVCIDATTTTTTTTTTQFACFNYGNSLGCLNDPRCFLYGETCTPAACTKYTSESECQGKDGCQWNNNECSLSPEYVASNPCEGIPEEKCGYTKSDEIFNYNSTFCAWGLSPDDVNAYTLHQLGLTSPYASSDAAQEKCSQQSACFFANSGNINCLPPCAEIDGQCLYRKPCGQFEKDSCPIDAHCEVLNDKCIEKCEFRKWYAGGQEVMTTDKCKEPDVCATFKSECVNACDRYDLESCPSDRCDQDSSGCKDYPECSNANPCDGPFCVINALGECDDSCALKNGPQPSTGCNIDRCEYDAVTETCVDECSRYDDTDCPRFDLGCVVVDGVCENACSRYTTGNCPPDRCKTEGNACIDATTSTTTTTTTTTTTSTESQPASTSSSSTTSTGSQPASTTSRTVPAEPLENGFYDPYECSDSVCPPTDSDAIGVAITATVVAAVVGISASVAAASGTGPLAVFFGV